MYLFSDSDYQVHRDWLELHSERIADLGRVAGVMDITRQVISSLNDPELAFLRSGGLRILDWGCEFGDAVAVLAEAFPGNRVTGIEFVPAALEEAKQRYPSHEFLFPEDSSGEMFDVITNLHCLQQFESPLEIVRRHVESCRALYIIAVPDNECPLAPTHRTQFREESFPLRIGGFARLLCRSTAPDSLSARKELVVVYASSDYLAAHLSARHGKTDDEIRKWDAYYESLPPDEPPELRQFGEEFRAFVDEIMPAGARVLEAGCGAGWQSLALARSGRYDITLLDFSPQAVEFARGVFERAEQIAQLQLGDLFEPGRPEYELVFNSGVIEHYPFSRQVEMLRALASRSRRYVLVLAPNTQCYWYWIARVRNASRGGWPFGAEVPVGSLREAFEAAGLNFLGHRYLGRAWTQAFIRNLPEIDPSLRDLIVECHRGGLLPVEQTSYIVAALGSLQHVTGQREGPVRIPADMAELRAIAADALAVRLAGDRDRQRCADRVSELEREAAGLRLEVQAAREALAQSPAHAQELNRLEREIDDVRDALIRSGRDVEALRSVRLVLEERVRSRSREAELAKALDGNARLRKHIADLHAAAGLFQEILESKLSEYRGQRAWHIMLAIRKAYTLAVSEGWAGRLRLLRWAGPPLHAFELSFPEFRDYLPVPPPEPQAGPLAVRPRSPALEHVGRKYDLVVLAIIDFDFRFQRPQQIAVQFAREGHRVFWISPTRFLPPSSDQPYVIAPLRENLWEVHIRGRQPDIYLGELKDEDARRLLEGLQALCRDWAVAESCVLAQLPFWRRLALLLRASRSVVLTYDCMDDWDTFQNMGRFNLDEESKLAQEANVLVVTAAALEAKFASRGLRPVLVRNGVEFEFFAAAHPGAELGKYARPIIGYFGAIADWIDLDLLADVATARPAYTFVVIGQVFNRDTSRLERLPNVALLGHKNYREIPSYLCDFDVCIIPFLLNRVTHATDPVKLYEYLSLGKPVVATAMAELRRLSDLVYLAGSPGEFAQKLDAALAESDPELCRRRIAFAAANTWPARVAQIDAAVSKSFPLVSILIVTHNSGEYVRPCLESLRRNTSYPRWEVLVVDNASEDETRTALGELASVDGRLRLWLHAQNDGFAGANNFAAHQAHGDYLVFLNADTMVSPGWLGRLLRHASDPSIGIVVPVTNFAGNETKIDFPYTSAPEMEEFALQLATENAGEAREIPVAPLFCAMVPRAVWEKVGELDEQFGTGMFEDDDFSFRLRQAGYRVLAAEDCFVHHFGQGSFSKLQAKHYDRVFRENRRRFEEKWGIPWQAHKLRPGVRPPLEDRRFKVSSFCLGQELQGCQTANQP